MLLWWGVGLLALATVLGAVVVFAYPATSGFDRWWNDTIAGARADWMVDFALALNWVGGGWVAILGVPLLTILVLVIARRWRGALFAAAASNAYASDYGYRRCGWVRQYDAYGNYIGHVRTCY